MWIISSTYIFLNQIEIIFFRFIWCPTKVLVTYAFLHHTFHQALFDMAKNEDVISQPVTMEKNINTICWSGVILEQLYLILLNLLSFPKLKSTSISYGESRRDRWARDSVTASVLTVLYTTLLNYWEDNVSSGHWFLYQPPLAYFQYEDLLR